ncbi:MAG TPA: hypothetical protein EYP90_07090 [Chromatiaceae bacterium]|nr:hypothetical protein [Chromatiaceae bacterium]
MLKVKVFKPAELTVGPVRLKVLELVDEKWEEVKVSSKGQLLSRLYDLASQQTYAVKRSIEEGYVVAAAEGGGMTVTDGEGVIKGARRLLWSFPAKLIAVGVARAGMLASPEAATVDELEWYRVEGDGEYYVFEGDVEAADDDVVLVILRTEAGDRYIVLATEEARARILKALPERRRGKRKRRRRRRA